MTNTEKARIADKIVGWTNKVNLPSGPPVFHHIKGVLHDLKISPAQAIEIVEDLAGMFPPLIQKNIIPDTVSYLDRLKSRKVPGDPLSQTVKYKLPSGRASNNLPYVIGALMDSKYIEKTHPKTVESIFKNPSTVEKIEWIGTWASLAYFAEKFGSRCKNETEKWEAAENVFTKDSKGFKKRKLQDYNKGPSKKDRRNLDSIIQQIIPTS